MDYRLTPYDDVNQVLGLLADDLQQLLGNQLTGLHLTGSLTYGDFDKGSSDIDFLAVLQRKLTAEQFEAVRQLHRQIGAAVPFWSRRLEGSYITEAMARTNERPAEKRPYVTNGTIIMRRYGHEWTLNLYSLQEAGRAIIGREPTQIFPKVTIEDVRAASKQALLADWRPKLNNPAAFNHEDYDTNHLKAYATLTMCRFLFTAKHEGVVSKRVASTWAKETYGEPWHDIIACAEQWQYGKTMSSDEAVKDFMRFTIKEVI